MLLRTNRRAQFNILSHFLEIVLLKSTSRSPWMLRAILHLDVFDKLFDHVWETACTLLWGERTDSVKLRDLATCSTFCFLLQKSNLVLSWQWFRTCSADDGTAIPSGSSKALHFWFLPFILVPTFFRLDCFNRDAAFLSWSATHFFLSSSSERGCSLLSAGVHFYALCCLLLILMDQVNAFSIAQSMKVASWEKFQ